MTGVVLVNPRVKFTNSAGAPIALGWVTVYQAGTTTLANTWQDKAQTTLNTNPIHLDANGECLLWGDSAQSYKLLLQDANLATVSGWPVDNIPGAADVGAAAAAATAAATTQAGIATTQAGIATTQAGLAQTYAGASASSAKFFDTIALGRAGVADTFTFGVKAGGSDALARPTVYRRDSSSTQTLLYSVVPGTEFDSTTGSNRAEAASSEMAIGDYSAYTTSTTLGATTPNTTTLNAIVVANDDLVTASLALLTSVSYRVAGAGSAELHVYKKVDATHWIVTNVIPVTFGAAGVFTVNAGDGVLPVGIEMTAGGFVGFSQTGSFLRYGAGAGPLWFIVGDTGVGSTVTQTNNGASDPALSYTVQAVSNTLATRVGAVESNYTANAAGRSVAALLNDSFASYMSTETLGSVANDVSTFTPAIIANDDLLIAARGRLKSVSIRVAGAGTGEIHVYSQLTSTTWKVTNVIPVTFAGSGAFTYTAGIDFAADVMMTAGGFVAFNNTGSFLRFGAGGAAQAFQIINSDTGVGSTVTRAAPVAFDPALSFTVEYIDLFSLVDMAVKNAGANYGLTPLLSATNAYALGDSTVAAFSGGTAVPDLMGTVRTEVIVAFPGDTIAQQKTRWQALTISNVGWVILQVGLNDMDSSIPTATTIAALQDLVNTVRTSIGASKKLLISQMTPARQRFIDLYGATNGALSYTKWQDVNTAIAGGGGSPITGVDGRITAHVALLNDGSGNLASPYDVGDHIHQTNAGRQIVARVWVNALNAIGMVP